MTCARRGAALLEALVALTVVTIAATTGLGALASAIHEQAALIERQAEMREAGELLAAYSLLTRDQLDQRLGQHFTSRWALQVERPEATLYRLAIASLASPRHELLVTVVYRPATP